MNAPLPEPDRTAIAAHCRGYVAKFQRITLSDGRSIPRQQRSLESERESKPDDDRNARPPERIVTPEAQLFARLGPNTARRIFVTGDAATGDGGSGKSEFTRQLAYVAAKAALEVSDDSFPLLVPVRYELSSLELDDSIFQEMMADSGLGPVFQRLVQRGLILIILDGLDELRRQVADVTRFDRQLRDLLAETRSCPIVIAGREASLATAWKTRLGISDGTTYRLKPFDDPQIEKFVRGYFGTARASTADRFIAALPTVSQSVRPLLRQPFMLAMACAGVDGGAIALPADPASFFRHGLESLLHARRSHDLPPESRMIMDPLTAIDRLGLLAAFACERDFRFHQTDKDFPAKKIAADANAVEAALKDLAPNSGILAVKYGKGPAEYFFTNRVVAEYLAGTYIAEHDDDPLTEPVDVYTTREPKVKPASLRFYGRHVWNDRLSNVLRWLAAGWRRFRAEDKTTNRVVSWLVAELRTATGGCRRTLLVRLRSLLSNFDDDSFPDGQEIVSAVTGVFPPLTAPRAGLIAQLVGFPACVALPYLNAIAAELDSTRMHLCDDVSEAAHALTAIAEVWPQLGPQVSNTLQHALGDQNLHGSDVAEIACAISVVALRCPTELQPIFSALETKLQRDEMDVTQEFGVVEGLVALAKTDPAMLDRAVKALADKSKQRGLDGFQCGRLAVGLAAIQKTDPAPLEEALLVLINKFDQLPESPHEYAFVAKSLAEVVANCPQLADGAFEVLVRELRKEPSNWTAVRGVADGLRAIGKCSPQLFDKIVEETSRQLQKQRGGDGVNEFARALVAIAMAHPASTGQVLEYLLAKLDDSNLGWDGSGDLVGAIVELLPDAPLGIIARVDRSLTDKWINSRFDSTNFSRAYSALAIAWPSELFTAWDRLTCRLRFLRSLHGYEIQDIAEALVAIATALPECTGGTVDALIIALNEPDIDEVAVASLAHSLTKFAASSPESLDAACAKLITTIDERDVENLFHPHFGLFEAAAAVAVALPRSIDKVLAMFERYLGKTKTSFSMNPYNVAEAVAMIAVARAEATSRAISILSKMLGDSRFFGDTYIIVRSLVEITITRPAIAATEVIAVLKAHLVKTRPGFDYIFDGLVDLGAGRAHVAAVLLRARSETSPYWKDFVLISGEARALRRRATRLGWREVPALPQSAAAMPGAVVIWPPGGEATPLDDPTKLVTRSGGPPPAEPEFLLARREDLTPGLDPTLCPQMSEFGATTLRGIAEELTLRGIKGKGGTPDKNQGLVLLALLRLAFLLGLWPKVRTAAEPVEPEDLLAGMNGLSSHVVRDIRDRFSRFGKALAPKEIFALLKDAKLLDHPGAKGKTKRMGLQTFIPTERELRKRIPHGSTPTAVKQFVKLYAALNLGPTAPEQSDGETRDRPGSSTDGYED